MTHDLPIRIENFFLGTSLVDAGNLVRGAMIFAISIGLQTLDVRRSEVSLIGTDVVACLQIAVRVAQGQDLGVP